MTKKKNSRKFIFLPHCLRNINCCKASVDENGYHCVLCGQCSISEVIKSASLYAHEVYIVPGASLIKKLFSKLKIDTSDQVIGIACETELADLKNNFITGKVRVKNKIAIKLKKDGCINTEFDLNHLLELLKKT